MKRYHDKRSYVLFLIRKTKTYAGVVAAATLLKAIISHAKIFGNR
jgi:hypothetical protein